MIPEKFKFSLSVHRSCLFVNSDPIDQSIFIAALSDISPETDCFLAVNDEEALDIMQEDGVVPDYIFIELDMPGIDGNRFLKRVRRSSLCGQCRSLFIAHTRSLSVSTILKK